MKHHCVHTISRSSCTFVIRSTCNACTMCGWAGVLVFGVRNARWWQKALNRNSRLKPVRLSAIRHHRSPHTYDLYCLTAYLSAFFPFNTQMQTKASTNGDQLKSDERINLYAVAMKSAPCTRKATIVHACDCRKHVCIQYKFINSVRRYTDPNTMIVTLWQGNNSWFAFECGAHIGHTFLYANWIHLLIYSFFCNVNCFWWLNQHLLTANWLCALRARCHNM